MTYPAQPQYQPQMPQYPQQAPPAPPILYPPQMPYGYPPQQWQPPAPPLAKGTLEDFYNQPSAGGGTFLSWSKNRIPKPVGTTYAGVVSRAFQPGDIRQRSFEGQPMTYRDGRPKFSMVVPMDTHPTEEFPDGKMLWDVHGQARDALIQAMTDAGCSQDVINSGFEAGAGIQIMLVERKPGRGGIPSNIVQVRYQRPASATNSAPVPPAQPSAPMHQGPAQPQQPTPYVGPVPPAQPQQPTPQIPTQPTPTAMTTPPELTEEQKQILAQLTGQAQQ